MGMATMTFMVHIDEEGRSIGDMWVLIWLQMCLDCRDQLIIFRHEDLLHNLGIHGNDFVKQNEEIVIEMTCKFLEYVKSAWVQAAESDSDNTRNPESEDIKIRMTPNGHPIIPRLVMEKELRKAEWEKLLWAYLSQNYCELWFWSKVYCKST
jgi:hypothetical protein